ncbi:MAG: NADH-quinone oxidoreductase subunit NuoG [Deltaproteobacteria bacterium]|nr:NADH-quinone oxidoreductase subunit NuoG [Deltaproteobacteria bacterium]
MATIFIDNTPYKVENGQNLLSACLSLGFNIPYFCWHPAMNAVGACRMCAVKQFRDEKDTRGSIAMSCMTPAADGTRISIDDHDVREFRAGVIEWLMINHPHDCPVCDEGGECHLQDMTVMSGHVYRKYQFKKRTYRNQNLGPFINHEMNRCIQCYRCVRFYREYAGGRDFNVFGIHDRVYFGRYDDGVLENEFSGNLVEVCPTGVFGDKTLKKHYVRKWDLQTAPSICVHCGLGCNTIVGERYGSLRRIQNKYNHEVNGYFLCDRGRFGYEFVNSEHRIRQPLLRQGQKDTNAPLDPTGKKQILDDIEKILTNSARVIGIGSPRATLEANFSLRLLVGQENFYVGMSETERETVSTIIDILNKGPAYSPSLRDVEMCDAVLILGEDVTNVAPRLALSLRQSVRNQPMEIADRLKIPRWADGAVRQAVQSEKGPLFIISPTATKLDDIATRSLNVAPDDIARLGFQIAHEVNPEAPEVNGLPESLREMAVSIATTLKQATRPLIVSGTSCGTPSVIQAAANVAWALCSVGRKTGLCYTVPECNSLGLGLMGGGHIKDCFEEVMSGSADTLIILENDLYRRAEVEIVHSALKKCKHVIVIDHILSRTAKEADVVLAAGTFAETTGSMVNSEGRCQRLYGVIPPSGETQESHHWIRDIMKAVGRTAADYLANIENISAVMAKELPIFKPVMDIAPPDDFRVVGQKIPRQPHRYSGRTAMFANISVHEPKPPNDPESPLAFSMEGYPGIPPAPLVPRFWSPGWNSGQAVNKFQREIGGPLIGGDPGKRLIEPSMVKETVYFKDVPESFEVREGSWLVVPVFHIFGSEELSSLGPAISERAPDPYVGLNQEDADSLKKKNGDEATLVLGNVSRSLPVRIITSLQRGVIALPVGLSGLEGIALPARGRILGN